MSQEMSTLVKPESLVTPPSDGAPIAAPAAAPQARVAKRSAWRPWAKWAAVIVGVALLAYYLTPAVVRAFTTVSTDDAYVNSHVTFVAARVAGQVQEVLVDDNMRVEKGSVLVRLDKEPYRVQLEIKKASVTTAEADLVAAQAQVLSLIAQARANRFKLDHAIEDVKNQVATLNANVATLKSRQATAVLAHANLKRREELIVGRAITKEELEDTQQQSQVADAMVEEAREKVYASRVSLGLPAKPGKGHELTDVPKDIYENFSTIRQALGDLMHSAAQLGFAPATWDATPKQAIDYFYQQDPEGNLDRFLPG